MNKIKTITIVLVISMLFPLLLYGEIRKPVAQFAFGKTTYQEGEPIEVIESSYSPSGLKIVKKEWKIIIDGKQKTSSNAKCLMNNIKQGEYTLY